MKFLNSLQPLGLLLLRAALGIIFFTHGYPKLTQSATAMQTMFIEHGLPGQFVYVAGVLETFGGLLMIIGIFTRVAALLLAIEMAVAIWKVHSVHGLMAIREYEFPLTLAAGCLALATVGAGTFSVDRLLFGEAGQKPLRSKKGAKKYRL